MSSLLFKFPVHVLEWTHASQFYLMHSKDISKGMELQAAYIKQQTQPSCGRPPSPTQFQSSGGGDSIPAKPQNEHCVCIVSMGVHEQIPTLFHV